jgi:hypothetical protein
LERLVSRESIHNNWNWDCRASATST